MITDKNLRVSAAQAVTTTDISKVDGVATSIDLTLFRDMAAGRPFYCIITVNTSGTPGAGTVAFQVITTSDDALTTAVLPIAQSKTWNDEDITAGMAPIPIIVGSPNIANEAGGTTGRYMGVRYNCATALPAGYAFTADFVVDVGDGLRYYSRGITF